MNVHRDVAGYPGHVPKLQIDERHVVDGTERLGDQIRQRPQPLAAAGGEHDSYERITHAAAVLPAAVEHDAF